MEFEGPSVLWGLYLGLLGIIALFQLSYRWSRRRRLKPDKFSHATIARDLAPKLTQLLSERMTLYVTEGDALPLTRRVFNPWWRLFIRHALRKKCVIHYVLTNVSPYDEKKLRELKTKLEAGTEGTIDFCLASSERVEEDDRDLIMQLRTFHTLLAEGKGSRAMWIEGYHPIASTIAYGCEFVPPEQAIEDKRFDEYKAKSVHLVRKYGSPSARLQTA